MGRDERWPEVDQSIKVFDRLVILCSENSLRNGRILADLEQALDREQDRGKRALFLVRADDYLVTNWQHARKAAVLERCAGDFRGWEASADRYETAFAELLERLDPAAAKARARRIRRVGS